MRAELDSKMETTEMRMIRWMCDVSLKERQRNTELRKRLGVEVIGNVMRRSRLRWHGHVERKGDADRVNASVRAVVEGNAPIGRGDECDRVKWMAIGRHTGNPATSGTQP